MNNHIPKFAFLAAVVAAALFSRVAYPTSRGALLANTSSIGAISAGGGAANEVPFFVFAPAAVSAGTPNAATGDATGTSSRIAPGIPPPPALHDASSIVMDLANSAVVEATDPDRHWPTASLAKLMSATIVLDKVPTSTTITVTSDISAVDPGERNLAVGGRYTVDDLLHAMLLPSSNVAAVANASFYGLNSFIAEMNARAAAWGMANTHYDDPSGISAGDESTANDLAKLGAVIYSRYARILAITNTPSYVITDLVSGKTTTIRSINDFAGKPGFVGGKTGYTEQADGNLLSILQSGSRPPVVVIVLGSSDRFGDTQALYNWFKANFK